jgi:DNA repair exonuclease SbcCD ATPase subunit
MLLENNPRGADKVFHRIGAKLPLEIELEDFKGNIINRKRKEYALNGIKFKAFNNDVPLPIKELFPLKEINWHRQLDPHYLILSTPGNAAKVLGASTGLEEQELIVKQIKDRLSECKSEIKHLTINNQEARDKMRQLRPIAKLLMQSRSIKAKEKALEKASNQSLLLQDLILEIERKERKITKYDVQVHMAKCLEILAMIDKYEKSTTNYNLLVDLVFKVKDYEHIAEEKINNHLKELNSLQNKINNLTEKETLITSLQQTLIAAKTKIDFIDTQEALITEKETQFNNLMKQLKICPLCDSTI